jgi:multisubunit Na+/H+ antiporter MnhC subunit
VAPGLGSGHAPILPISGDEPVADPLAQALALTAAVIGFGTTVLLLRLVLALAETHDTLLLEELAEAERDEPEGDA